MIEKLREMKEELEKMADTEYKKENENNDSLIEDLEKAIKHIRYAIIELNNK